VSCVTEIIGRYRHFKQKSSSIACRQFQEYITLAEPRLQTTVRQIALESSIRLIQWWLKLILNYLKWLERIFLRLKIAKRNVQLLRTTLLCPS